MANMPIGWTDFPAQQSQQPQGGFLWGAGGVRLTPEQLADREKFALNQMAPDFSPVEGGVLGALARGAQGIAGAMQLKGAEKQQGQANADAQSRIAATLGKDADLAPLFTSGDKVAASLASDVFGLRNPKADNNDTANDFAFFNQQLGPQAGQQYLHNLLDPIVNVPLPDGRIYSGPRSGLASIAQGGGGPASTGQGAPPATLPPDFDFGEGGPASASGTFRP